jgi:hypothetical protein
MPHEFVYPTIIKAALSRPHTIVQEPCPGYTDIQCCQHVFAEQQFCPPDQALRYIEALETVLQRILIAFDHSDDSVLCEELDRAEELLDYSKLGATADTRTL